MLLNCLKIIDIKVVDSKIYETLENVRYFFFNVNKK